MEFVNRGVSSIFIIALVFLSIIFLFNILPIILLVGVGLWGLSHIIKSFGRWRLNREKVFRGNGSNFEKVDVREDNFTDHFDIENAIDIEYREID